ncbi:MAG: PrsW family intramembrane metalloprotease [Archaeoglobus sp.]|nr:PrsW family intramembrane metalloprotease [Archaeoglobus sp.]
MDGVLYYLIFFAYAPAIGLLWYFYHKDRLEPEPLRYVAVTFLYGAVISIGIAMFIESISTLLIPRTFLTISILAAIVEEPAKALAIRIPYEAKQMDGVMDGVVYGTAAGLGFAATENLLYGFGLGLEVTLMRVLLTPIAHGTWTSIVGVGFGLKSERKVNSILPFMLLAIILHFSWDYLVFQSEEHPLYSVLVFFLLILNVFLIRYFLSLGIREDIQKFGGGF